MMIKSNYTLDDYNKLKRTLTQFIGMNSPRKQMQIIVELETLSCVEINKSGSGTIKLTKQLNKLTKLMNLNDFQIESVTECKQTFVRILNKK